MKLEDITMKEVTDYLINDIVEEYGVSKNIARKLFINAISCSLVIKGIKDQIDYLIAESTDNK